MSEIDEIKKRINHRNKPLNDRNFKKIYNGMIRFMLCLVVLLSGGIIQKNPKMIEEVLNHRYIEQAVDFISQSVMEFLPEDLPVSLQSSLFLNSDGTYRMTANQVTALEGGRISAAGDDSLSIIQDNAVTITYNNLQGVMVRKGQNVKTGDVLASYHDSFMMTFSYLGKEITYQEYQEL